VRNKSIISLASNHHGKYYDNLGFFRALALSKICKCKTKCMCVKHIEQLTLKFFPKFCAVKSLQCNKKSFESVDIQDFGLLEEIFNMKITVYTLDSFGVSSIQVVNEIKLA